MDVGCQTVVPAKVKRAWIEFMNETSAHGCRPIMRRRRFTSVLWALLVLGMSASLIAVLIELFVTYQKHPIKTVENVHYESTMRPPALTFCLPGKIDMTKMNKSSILYDFVSKAQATSKSFRDFFKSDQEQQDYMKQVNEYVNEMPPEKLRRITYFNVREVFLNTGNSSQFVEGDKLNVMFKPNPNPCQACWTYNWNVSESEEINTFTASSFLLDVKSNRFPPNILYSGMEIYVHERDTSFLAYNVHLLQPGTCTSLYFRKTEHRYLPLPYHSFGDKGCLDVDSVGFQNPLKMWPKYSKINCVLEKLIIKVRETCNCSDPYAMSVGAFPNVSECSFIETIMCVKPMFEKFPSFAARANDIGCLHECKYASYDVTLTTAAFPSESITKHISLSSNQSRETLLKDMRENYVLLVNQPMDATIRIIEHVPEITLLSIFGKVGGYMGLFLGASLLTLTELLETIVKSVWLLGSRIRKLIVKPA